MKKEEMIKLIKDTLKENKELIKQLIVDENAETLQDKLRMEHTPTLEELESAVNNRPQP